MNQPEIRFIEVKTALEKKELLISLITSHFEKGLKQLVFLPTKEAVIYMDHLLWSDPFFSFLPHSSAEGLSEQEQIQERVLLSHCYKENLNRAEVIINLANQPVSWHVFSAQPALIVELIDHTHPERLQRAIIHQAHYNRCDS